MNPEIETPQVQVKRGPGRPRKQAPQPIEVKPGEMVLGHAEALDFDEEVAPNPLPPKRNTHPTQSLGDLYLAIDAAPKEWLPSLLAKVVKRSLREGVWISVENLILSVRAFTK